MVGNCCRRPVSRAADSQIFLSKQFNSRFIRKRIGLDDDEKKKKYNLCNSYFFVYSNEFIRADAAQILF